jgi:hypothetical protein
MKKVGVCKNCGHVGHVKARCPELRSPSGHAFTVEELAFFQVPRDWTAITARFGSQRALNGILEADDDGRDLLWWCRRSRTWRLTDNGKEFTSKVAAA